MSVLVKKIFTKNRSDVHYFFTDFRPFSDVGESYKRTTEKGISVFLVKLGNISLKPVAKRYMMLLFILD